MDENYLDNLLNEFSLDKEIDNKIEDELDDQIAKEKQQHQKKNAPSREDLFNMGLEKDAEEGLLNQDLSFSEEQMDELDALDDLADLDIGDLDFSDIDFDDLDITRLEDVDTSDIDELLKDFEGNLEVDDSFDEDILSENEQHPTTESRTEGVAEVQENNVPQQDDLNEDSFDADSFLDSLMNDEDEKSSEESPIVELEEDVTSVKAADEGASMEELSDGDLDALLNSLAEEETPAYDTTDEMEGFSDSGKVEETGEEASKPEVQEETLSGEEEENIDDLFSLLDLDENEQEEVKQAQENKTEPAAELDESEQSGAPEESDSASAVKKQKKKKKSLADILFGEDDEELSDEQIAELEAKKAEKKAEKKAKKQADKEAKKEKAEAAKAEKEQKLSQKRKEDTEKQKVKAEKRARKKALELENQEPEKKLNGAMVVFVFSLFLGGSFVLYLAANNFNYSQAIQKATDYFESQKYHRAYDEIKGVEVKEKDQDLKDRIYTVMYVERLYESYENNRELGFYDKALDSLLRGVDKYNEHYEEAVELGIVSDIDYSFSRIQDALMANFSISVDEAVEINKLDDDEYVLTIRSYVENNESKLMNHTSEESDDTETAQK